ncbi:germination protein YpeB [Paenibacillus aquistagni]|uniref:Spore germination protein n=1 Tax=Paenibacillus aquistagni TaxID=1852522 RepID=A0A1X7JHN1_9BACL|nr:germination protein YpeB [Paenibacillus aquistagni]SMG27289.1 spore germination protein [Paenibacillus aquistagni]
MYKRLSAVMFPIVTLFLIGAVIWGYQEHQEKNSILLKAENQYQRAFHDLSYHMNKLHNELGQTLAVHSASQGMHRKSLVNVWRLTSEAQNEINQLPLTLMPFSQTEDFLSRISNFAYRAAVRDMTKEPLNQDEMKTLKTLYANSKQISDDLLKVEKSVIDKNLRWMDVESAIATEKQINDNTIIDGFKTVDNKVGQYPEINWGPSVASIYAKRSVRMLEGPPISEQDVKNKAMKFLRAYEVKDIKVQKNGNSKEYETYTVSAMRTDGNGKISLDFTLQGQLLSYFNSRNVDKKDISNDDAMMSASRFLKKHGYPQMEPVRYQVNDNIESLTFVPVENGIYMYPKQLQVRVALDNGEITGLQASDYVYHHADKTKVNLKPKLTKDEALSHVNPDMKVNYSRLALINNEVSQKVLCYEFGGSFDKQGYRIYINADTGLEESIEPVSS